MGGDIVVQGDSQWPTLFVGFLGVVVGAASVFVLEHWRQVISFRAAAKVVRFEIDENVRRASRAIHDGRVGVATFLDEAWGTHRADLVALLDESTAQQVSAVYYRMFIMQNLVGTFPTRFDESKLEIEPWIGELVSTSSAMKQVEGRPRLFQLRDALFARPTFSTAAKNGSAQQ